MIKTSGPVPLLALAVVFSIALFFCYRELTALKAKVDALDKSIPTTVATAVDQRLSQSQVDNAAFVDPYASFAAELPDFAEEAARALSESFVARQAGGGNDGTEVIDVTDAGDATAEEAATASDDVAVAKRRTKKTA